MARSLSCGWGRVVNLADDLVTLRLVAKHILNHDGFRVGQCSSKSSHPCPIGATVALHESVETDCFGAPAES